MYVHSLGTANGQCIASLPQPDSPLFVDEDSRSPRCIAEYVRRCIAGEGLTRNLPSL